MTIQLQEVRRRLKVAEVLRKKGIALSARSKKKGDSAFQDAIEHLNEALKLLPDPADKTARMTVTEAADLAEVLGSKGGLLRRLGRSQEALSSYCSGATVEDRYRLPSTYNRVNEVKWALLTGESDITASRDKLEALVTTLRGGLNRDTEISELVWSWADLGDCLALLGRVEEAVTAYTVFIERSESQSPKTTLSVLSEVADQLKSRGSEEAPAVRQVLEELTRKLRQT